ncbi:DUF2357 domain-containing protein [Lactiplantibacillus plantarum]|uniref:DUF2357 domain-containing protein n=1 Tax=Lactiplantibacillus plantarum TaxID=1590 RepID=UPI000FFECC89|nr:DUF2357 domain-containing protein [Lactiplantibacillus plantarum]RXE77073.1 DUF2357 domain-containing protein [Lactiplantibacillus plantarum]RZN66499.1 DUF2357 domain-containing protein [Lactiplantibacillus plantarum]
MSVDGYLISSGRKRKLIFTTNEISEKSYNEFNKLKIITSCKENTKSYLLFFGNTEAKVYVDNARIANISSGIVDEIDNTLYFQPNASTLSDDKAVKFFIFKTYEKNDTNETGLESNMNHYGPGIYRIKIIEPKEPPKFSYLQIMPKFLTEAELVLMREEVESVVLGMARKFEMIHNGKMDLISGSQESNFIHELEYLHSNKNNFQNLMFNIVQKPRQNIKKLYNWHIYGNGVIDNKSNRVMETRQRSGGKIYAYKRYNNLDLQENRVIKYQLSKFYLEIQRIKEKIEKYRYKIKLDYEKESSMLKLYASTLSRILNKSYFIDIKEKNGILPNSAMLDITYRGLYSFIDCFFKDTKKKDNIIRQYMYDWLRTEDLYEVWGFVRSVQALLRIGLTPISGWIFSDETYKVGTLEHKTSVYFEVRDENDVLYLKVQLCYNPVLPNRPDKETLLWTTSRHRKPDIVLNVLDPDGTLLGTRVLDTKYRSISKKNSGPYNASKEIREQLSAYRDSIKSEHFFSSDVYEKETAFQIVRQRTPVNKVAVILPKLDENSRNSELYLNEASIEAIDLRVGKGDDKLIGFFTDELKNDLKYVNDFFFKQRLDLEADTFSKLVKGRN